MNPSAARSQTPSRIGVSAKPGWRPRRLSASVRGAVVGFCWPPPRKAEEPLLEEMTSLIAKVALLVWVPVSLVVFSQTKPHRAVASLLLGAALFLPERAFFSVKLLPNIDKKTIACAWVLIPMLVWGAKRLRRTKLGGLPRVLFGLLFLVDVGRALTNMDALPLAAAIEPHTALTFLLDDVLRVYTPYLLGAALFSERQSLTDLLRSFAIAGALYAPLVILELKFSPQLHSWVYGFMQHEWQQVIREGGYRPMVFMEHGLAVALFLCSCALCAIGLSRARVSILGFRASLFAALLSALVLVNPSFGSRLFLVALAPLVAWGSPKLQVRAAAAMGILVLLYPILRASDLLPTRELVDTLAAYKPDRAGSLAFRFENEDLVLERALKRPLFGWGGFERKFIYNPETEKFNVLDGAWIITYADSGALGFLAKYGMMVWPLWVALRRFRQIVDRSDRILVSTLAVVLAMNVVDLLPNGMFTYFPMLLAGSLLGAVRYLSQAQPQFGPGGVLSVAAEAHLRAAGAGRSAARAQSNPRVARVVRRG